MSIFGIPPDLDNVEHGERIRGGIPAAASADLTFDGRLIVG